MNTRLRKLAVPALLAAGIGAGATFAGVMERPVPPATAQAARPLAAGGDVGSPAASFACTYEVTQPARPGS